VQAISEIAAPAAPASDPATPQRELLRFLTCGSVDDGKSTLIGRLLFDAALVLDDHLKALERDSKAYGTVGGDVDVALLLDGLEAEREQGITIDVAYRHFATSRRRFIVADTPGHIQYTRNMVTGASTADLAVLLVDATKGLLEQTRRHCFLCSLLGIRNVVLAVNKMDLVAFDPKVFADIEQAFRQFAEPMKFRTIAAIPTSARFGDNVMRRSERAPWYRGPSLMEHLESVPLEGGGADRPFRMPVQWVNRPNADFRGYAGTLAGGSIQPGDEVLNARSGVRTSVRRIVTLDGDLDAASAGDAVTLVLSDELDVSRGDVLAAPQSPPQRADAFAAHIIWMADAPLLPGRSYLLKCAGGTVPATVTELKYRVDISNFSHIAAKDLHLNEIAFVHIATSERITFDAYDDNRDTGGFILIDRMTNATVGAGLFRFALYRSANVHWQTFDVTKESHARLKSQKPVILWFTGLSGAGKSTIANILERKLRALGKHTFLLDGDNIRHGLNRDLGFTEADRVENIRRVAEVAKLFVNAGIITLVAFISPFRAERRMAREIVEQDEFVEIFVDTPIAVCEQRDPKGLYGKARRGELQNFTGINSPYEPPENPELHLEAGVETPDQLSDRVVRFLHARGFIG